MGGKKNKDVFFDFLHSLSQCYRRFVYIDWLNVNGFFVCWIIEHVELSPQTRSFIVRKLLGMGVLNGLQGSSDSEQEERRHQTPEPKFRHVLSPNVK
jgi:hypothetical protein